MSIESRPEFSDIVAVEGLEKGPVRKDLAASEAECTALAGRFGLLSIVSLSAAVTLRRLPASPLVRVEGRLKADIAQRCILSLEPVADHIDVSFSEVFCPVDYQPRDELEADEIVDSFDDGGIDIGELVAQNLSLSLDPYPRAPGVEPPADLAAQSGRAGDEEKQRPLAGLGEMLRKRN